jgi:ABC-type branched-subunit amino acid transport system permease subunit
MHTFPIKPIAIILAVILMLFSAVSTSFALDSDPGAGAMIADTVLARPMGIATTIAGTVLFVVSSPFSALGGNLKAAYTKLIKEPFVFSFSRPLGEF